LGRLQEAIGHYREALRINPKFINAHENLAGVLRATGHAKEADVHLKEAERLKGNPARAAP